MISFTEKASPESNILELAVQQEIVDKSGSWFSYQDERLGQGKENVRIYLRDNPEICQEIEAKVREAFNLAPTKTNPPDKGSSSEE